MKNLYKIALLCIVATPLSALAEDDNKIKKNIFDIDLKTSYSNDFYDFSAGIGWNIEYSKQLGNESFSRNGNAFTYHTLSFSSSGSYLEDKALNRDPIKASFRYSINRVTTTPLSPPPTVVNSDGDSIGGGFFGMFEEDNTAPSTHNVNGRNIQNFLSLGAGLDLNYETDQASRNSSLNYSAFLALTNEYHLRSNGVSTDRLLTTSDRFAILIPSVELAVDAVHKDKNTLTSSGELSDENYTRLKAAVSWRYYLGHSFKNVPVELYSSVLYTIDLDQNAAWKAAGLDKSLGWFVEATYDLPSKVGRGKSIFLRASGGRVSPILEDDKSIMIGMRTRF